MQAIDFFDYCPFLDQTRRVWDAVWRVGEALDSILVPSPSVPCVFRNKAKQRSVGLRPAKVYIPTRTAHAHLFAVAAGFERVGSRLMSATFSDAAVRIAVAKLVERLYHVMAVAGLDISCLPLLGSVKQLIVPASWDLFTALLVLARAIENLSKQVAVMQGNLGLISQRQDNRQNPAIGSSAERSPPKTGIYRSAVPERLTDASGEEAMNFLRKLLTEGETESMTDV